MNQVLFSLNPRGLEADVVKIEVDHYRSTPGIVIVGLADTAVQESKERVRSAIKNSGLLFPRGRVVINLAPAHIKKSGPSFDLAMALGLLSLSHGVPIKDAETTLFFGELALNGSLRHVNGILGLVSSAKEKGFSKVVVPKVNAREASLVSGLTIFAAETLKQVFDFYTGQEDLEPLQVENLKAWFDTKSLPILDLSDIKGQAHAKRALEIAAAGGHNLLMNGAPGSGKTMLAKALEGILPPLMLEEALEVTKIYSLAGLLPEGKHVIDRRPFRIIHHTASSASLIGGGSFPKPGEISLAHRGVLFLDEIAEFPLALLDMLRQPLEDRSITISRVHGSIMFPAQFILCSAMNPCPCGYYQVPNAKKPCLCKASQIAKYQQRLSGPLLDRIDLSCTVSPVEYEDLVSSHQGEMSETVAARIKTARMLQQERFKGTKLTVNAEMTSKDIKVFCPLSPAVKLVLEQAMERFHLSARGYFQVIKGARTISDLKSQEMIGSEEIMEALQYRKSDDMLLIE